MSELNLPPNFTDALHEARLLDRLAEIGGNKLIQIHKAEVIFEPRDFWVGVYIHPDTWGDYDDFYLIAATVYICILPMLPLKLMIVFKILPRLAAWWIDR